MEGGAPGRPSPSPAPPPARPIVPGPVITPPQGGAEQTVPGLARTWDHATGGTAPGASVGPLICCSVATLRQFCIPGPFRYVGCSDDIDSVMRPHTKSGDVLIHDKMSAAMCVAFCIKRNLTYGGINGETG